MFKENLRRLRLESGMTQAELAAKLGVTQGTITQYENGWSEPRMGKIGEIAKIFNVSLSDLIYAETSNEKLVDLDLFLSPDESFVQGRSIPDRTCPLLKKIYLKYPDSFFFRVNSASYDRVLPQGAYALIVPTKVIEEGKVYAVCSNDGKVVYMQAYCLSHGFRFCPFSTDPTIKEFVVDLDVNSEKINVLGEAVYYVMPAEWTL